MNSFERESLDVYLRALSCSWFLTILMWLFGYDGPRNDLYWLVTRADWWLTTPGVLFYAFKYGLVVYDHIEDRRRAWEIEVACAKRKQERALERKERAREEEQEKFIREREAERLEREARAMNRQREIQAEQERIERQNKSLEDVAKSALDDF